MREGIFDLPRLTSRHDDQPVPGRFVKIVTPNGVAFVLHHFAQHIKKIWTNGAIYNERISPLWKIYAIYFQFLKLHQAWSVGHNIVGLIVGRAKYGHTSLTDDITGSKVRKNSPLSVIHIRVSRSSFLIHLLVDARVENNRGIVYLIDEVLLEF